jgi:hypothetical protein
MPKAEQLSASFRDPSGFLFTQNGTLYRQINRAYSNDYARLTDSGLYDRLVKVGLLIPHVEVDLRTEHNRSAYDDGPQGASTTLSTEAIKVIQPERVPFISYPYEWSFSQLKDAALATLSIQKRAMKLDLSLDRKSVV